MGACWSGGAAHHLLEHTDGGEEEYHKRFLEDQVLGEGEFGVVRLVHDILSDASSQQEPLACKVLRKGVVFKDNVLYSPLKPHVLKGEVEMLRTLAGRHYCLKLVAIYETPRVLLLVTEYCGGGEMMEYVAAQPQDLRTEDVSRIAFQLLSAVNHCARHGIIHRDIKPENTMFRSPDPKAELRLIDFGSGVMESLKYPSAEQQQQQQHGTARSTTTTRPEVIQTAGGDEELNLHTTFAGSAFYISPEMFQRKYTQRTDVWSAGVTLYVLVAGYPADHLQRAFNILQNSKRTMADLKRLPNMPDNMPESYYELLDACLVYRHRHRPSAGTLLSYDFCQFDRHLQAEQQDDDGLSLEAVAAAAAAAATASPPKEGSMRAASVSLQGSVVRHNLFLGFKKYERSLTTVLVAMLSHKDLEILLMHLRDRLNAKNNNNDSSKEAEGEETQSLSLSEKGNEWKGTLHLSSEQKLSVVPVRDLKAILRDDMKDEEVLETLEKIPNASVYDGFAYHVALLREFSKNPDGDGTGHPSASAGRRRSISRRDRRSFKKVNSSGNLNALLNNTNVLTSSFNSTSSGQRRHRSGASSLRGGSIFAARSLKTRTTRANSFSESQKIITVRMDEIPVQRSLRTRW